MRPLSLDAPTTGKVSESDLLPYQFAPKVKEFLLRCSVNRYDCWVYPSIQYNNNRYGPQIAINGKTLRLARVVYESICPPLGELIIKHACGNVNCVNPMHLYPERKY